MVLDIDALDICAYNWCENQSVYYDQEEEEVFSFDEIFCSEHNYLIYCHTCFNTLQCKDCADPIEALEQSHVQTSWLTQHGWEETFEGYIYCPACYPVPEEPEEIVITNPEELQWF